MKRLTPAFSLFFSLIIVCASIGCKDGGDNSTSKIAPPVPTGLQATEGVYKDKVDITWNAVEEADSYIIYKSIDNKDQYRAIASGVVELSYSDNTVTPNRHYFYRVAAANGDAWSQPSAEGLGYAHVGPPIAPLVEATTDVIGKINITWRQTPQTDTYKVLRSTKIAGPYAQLADGLDVLSYEDSSPDRDIKYYYKVVGISDVEGEGKESEAVYGISLQEVPQIPENITATDGSYENMVEITWNSSPLAVSYRVYRAPDNGGSAGEYILIAGNITTEYFEDTTCNPGETYYYKVSALSSGGESELGTEAIGKRITGAPVQLSAPANVSATNGEYDTIAVSWGEVEGAVGYSVYRSDSIGGTYVLIPGANKIAGTSYTDTPPALVSHYFYKVTSWSAGYSAESRESPAAEGYAMPQLPGVPGNVSATDDREDGKIVITWNASAGVVDTYKVYRAETVDGTYNLIASGLTARTYTDTAIIVGKHYFYKVGAINASGETMSAAEEGNTVLAVPTGLSVSQSGESMILTWNSVVGADAYLIQHQYTLLSGSPNANGWKDLVTVSTLTYTHANTKNSKNHHYRIKSVNSITSSAFSGHVSKNNY